MRTPVILLFLFAFVLFPAAAQESSALTPALLTLQKGNTVIHVFGSIHVGSGDMYPLPSAVEEAFAEADTLVVELDALEVSSLKAAGIMRKKLGYPRGDSLDKHLPEETYAALQAACKDFGLPLSAVRIFKPTVADMLITQMAAARAGYDGQNGIDVYFLRKAREAGKTIAPLETLEEQLDALARIPDHAQVIMLSRSLEDLGMLTTDLEKLVDVWRRGDLEACYAIEEKDLIDAPGLKPVYDILIAERNRTMAERLEKLTAGGGTFFVVAGVGHFAGPDSVIEILRQGDFTVERR